MSIRLKQRTRMLLVAGVALLAVALAILPAVAEAQDMATVPATTVESTNVSATPPARLPGSETPVGDGLSATDVSGVVTSQAVNSPPDPGPDTQAGSISKPLRPVPEPATRLVVKPGDSLWSISQERLGPNASPRQVLSEVERIFESNRDRMGDVSDLILPGQELLLPPVTETAAAAAVPERDPVPVGEPVALPDPPTTVGTVVVASVEPSPEPYYAFPRRLLGLGIMVLSLAVAVLMVWKLPMKRDVGDFVAWRRFDELPRPSPEHPRSTGVLSDEPPKAKTQRLRAGRREPRPYEVRAAKGFAEGSE